MDVSSIIYDENHVDKKIRIFHGLNSRKGFKGTHYIEKAFKVIQRKYPNEVECILDGMMPLDEYLNLMSSMNVVIDQANSYSLGVNGVYALAMGKVVMGGAEPESVKALSAEDSPVINIKPSVDDIVKKLEWIIRNRHLIEEISRESRNYVEIVHDSNNIAAKFIATWSE